MSGTTLYRARHSGAAHRYASKRRIICPGEGNFLVPLYV